MFPSLLPFFKKFRNEVILISIALIIAIVSSLIFFQSPQVNDEKIILDLEEETRPANKIMVDVAGAVNKPGVYEVSPGARLKDVIRSAQGLNIEADVNFFNRNFNLARYVSDQEKIYIPSTWEINTGYFLENKQTLDYTSAVYNPATQGQALIGEDYLEDDLLLININSATSSELDKLPGIGPATAKKIVDNRPYSSIDELSTKKIVNKNVWEQIKDSISTY